MATRRAEFFYGMADGTVLPDFPLPMGSIVSIQKYNELDNMWDVHLYKAKANLGNDGEPVNLVLFRTIVGSEGEIAKVSVEDFEQ